MLEATSEYRLEMDSVSGFLDQRCHRQAGAMIQRAELYRAYAEFCVFADCEPLSKRAVNSALRGQGFQETRITSGEFKGRDVWCGLALASASASAPSSVRGERR